MKTKEVTLYSFNELSHSAKKRAIESYSVFTEHVVSDFQEVMDEFTAHFGLCYGRNGIEFSQHEDEVRSLSGSRLRTYMINNFWDSLYCKKFMGSIGDNREIVHPRIKINRYVNGRVKSSNFYYSAITWERECPLTGMCYDFSVLKPIYDLIDWLPDAQSMDFEDLMNACVSSLEMTLQNQIDYMESDEYKIEQLEESEDLYLENGSVWEYEC